MAQHLHDWEMKWSKISAEVDKKGKFLIRLPWCTDPSSAVIVGVSLKIIEDHKSGARLMAVFLGGSSKL